MLRLGGVSANDTNFRLFPWLVLFGLLCGLPSLFTVGSTTLSVVSMVASNDDDAKEDDIVGDDSGDGKEVDVMVIIMYR